MPDDYVPQAESSVPVAAPDSTTQDAPAGGEATAISYVRIGNCEACGFPVSNGRNLCVECEQAGRQGDSKLQWNLPGEPESWWQSHSYTLGALLVAALTVALLALKMR